MSMGEMKPRGYKKMEQAEKKMEQERLRMMIRKEVRAALAAKKAVRKPAMRKRG